MRGKWLFGLVCVFAVCFASAADLKMQISSAFSGLLPSQGAFPVAATIQNLGPDARGVLHVSSQMFDMDYPVELPRGSVKRVLTFPTTSYSGEVSFELSTNQGNLRQVYRQIQTAGDGAHGVLMISDDEGELGFLRISTNNAIKLSDAYVRPEDAPDRVVAYRGLCGIVLGTGAERLPDSVVEALHLYVMAGGTILFVGGANSPTLSDPRWSDIAPVAAGMPKTVEKSGYADVDAPFSILSCTPAPGASVRKDGANILLARRWVGLGRTLFMAFNPFEAPFLRWDRRQKAFQNLLRPVDFDRTQAYLAQFTTKSGAEYGGSYSSYGYGSGGYAPPGGSYRLDDPSAARDPFSTKLPPIEKVLWILVGYFVAIIPVNFLLLKKLKKGELAWVTAPLISVGFAGVFFAAAGGLYTAKMSRATQGLLIATPGNPYALFVGSSQMFFPQGGTYDLKIQGMDSVGPSQLSDYGYYYYGEENNQFDGLNAIDDGEVRIRNMEVSNLAFRELSYHQTLPERSWFEVKLKRIAGGPTLEVRNTSDKILSRIVALVEGNTYEVPPLTPGEKKLVGLASTMIIPGGPNGAPRGGVGYQDLAELSRATKQIILKVDQIDLPVGPLIGEVVAARQRVTLAYFTGIQFGEDSL